MLPSQLDPRRRCIRPSGRLILLLIALVLTLLPVYWMVNTSLKTQVEIFATPPTLFPHRLVLTNYCDLFIRRNLGAYLFNSLFVVTTSVALAMVLGSLAAYALARFSLAQARERISFWVLAPRMIPPVAIVVPIFLMLQLLGLINKYPGLIL